MNAHAVAALPVRILRPLQPMTWLERAWHDIRLTPGVGFGHGAVMACFGVLVMLGARERFWLLAGSMSGFLLVAPILATGLYAVSRALERGETAGWSTVFTIWRSLDRRLVGFGLLLAAAGTGWVMTSAALITLMAPQPVLTPVDFVHQVVLNRESWLFEIWLALGGLLAAPVFASSVTAIPMLVDRQVSVSDAVLAYRAGEPGADGRLGGAGDGIHAARHGIADAGPDLRDADAGPCQLACLPRPAAGRGLSRSSV
mgnify:CR=1 FL=1